ncbi:hypothetical protein FRC17_001707 [Serendipita sp. 399]|nr:hypothetical protein FRC17_001707 [Serendipita sp. 399]
MQQTFLSILFYLTLVSLFSDLQASPLPADQRGVTPAIGEPSSIGGSSRKRDRDEANLHSADTEARPTKKKTPSAAGTPAGAALTPAIPASRTPAVPGTPLPMTPGDTKSIRGSGSHPLEYELPPGAHGLLHVDAAKKKKLCDEVQSDIIEKTIKRFERLYQKVEGEEDAIPYEVSITQSLAMTINELETGYMPMKTTGEAESGADMFHAFAFEEVIGQLTYKIKVFIQAKNIKYLLKGNRNTGQIEFTQANKNGMQMHLLKKKVEDQRKEVNIRLYCLYTARISAHTVAHLVCKRNSDFRRELTFIPLPAVLEECQGPDLEICKKDQVEKKRAMTQKLMKAYGAKAFGGTRDPECFMDQILSYARMKIQHEGPVPAGDLAKALEPHAIAQQGPHGQQPSVA